jgi:hypothetical protein
MVRKRECLPPVLESALDKDKENCIWLDGFNYKITIRRAALHPLFELAKERIQNKPNTSQGTGLRLPTLATICLLGKLVWMQEGHKKSSRF